VDRPPVSSCRHGDRRPRSVQPAGTLRRLRDGPARAP
jgi:hypothetical protein